MKKSDAFTFSLPELLEIASDPVAVDGELEHIVREIACQDCSHSNRADYLMRLMILIQEAKEDTRYLITSKVIEYAYLLTSHGRAGEAEYVKSLFQEQGDMKGGRS